MKESEIREILDRFPDMNIEHFLELGTHCPICDCYEEIGHNMYCSRMSEGKLQDFKGEIFSHMNNYIGTNHDDTFNMIPAMVKRIDAPIFFFLNVEKIGSKNRDGFLPNRPVREELDIILKNYNHPGIFCLTDFESWPEYPKWTPTISIDIILKIFQKHDKKILSHFEKNNHYIIVTS